MVITHQNIPEGWELVRVRKLPAEIQALLPKIPTTQSSSLSSSSLSPFDQSEAATLRHRIKKNGTGIKQQEREEREAERNFKAGEEKDKKENAVIETDDNVTQFDIQEVDSNSNPGENNETETDAVKAPELEEKSPSNSIEKPAEDSETKLKTTEKRKKPGLMSPCRLVICVTLGILLGSLPSMFNSLEIEQDVVLYEGKNHTGLYSFTEWTKWKMRYKKCVNLYGFNDRASSIDSLGACIQIFKDWDCKGRMAIIAPGTTSHWDLEYYKLDKAVSSIQPCGPTTRVANNPVGFFLFGWLFA